MLFRVDAVQFINYFILNVAVFKAITHNYKFSMFIFYFSEFVRI